jgi:hypothetical protein
MEVHMRVVAVVALFLLGVSDARAQVGQAADRVCDAVLVQNVDITQASDELKVAYIVLIDESNYEKAKKEFATSGAIDYIKLFTANGDLNYLQFDEQRRTFKKIDQYQMSRDRAVAITRRDIKGFQAEAWLKCILCQRRSKI